MDKSAVEIVVISLTTAAERRRKVTAMLEDTRHKWSFFDAHRGRDNPLLSYSRERILKKFGRELSPPEIAVYSSHFTVMEEFVRRGEAEYLLVLEDDVIFDVDFPIEDFAASCSQRHFDYIRLFGRNPAKTKWIGFFVDRSIVRYKSSPAGTQAYLMSRRGAQLFTEKFRSIEATIDLAMDRFWESQMPLYSIFPFPVIERYSPTSIPMAPEPDAMPAGQSLVWRVNRLVDKARKELANWSLGRSDAILRRSSPRFQQVR